MNRKLTTLLLATALLTGVGCKSDTEAPVITVNNKVVTAGTKVDKKSLYSVKDNMDDDPEVTVEGDIDTSMAGMYKLTVKAKDKAGNESSEVVKVVVKNSSSASGDAAKDDTEETDSGSLSESSSSSTSSSSSSSSSETVEGGEVVVEATGGSGATSFTIPKDDTGSQSMNNSSTFTASNEEEVAAFVKSAKSDPSQFLSSGSSLLDDGYKDHSVIGANGHSLSDTWAFVDTYLGETASVSDDRECFELYYYTDGLKYGWRDGGDADHFVGIVVCGDASAPASVS